MLITVVTVAVDGKLSSDSAGISWDIHSYTVGQQSDIEATLVLYICACFGLICTVLILHCRCQDFFASTNMGIV